MPTPRSRSLSPASGEASRAASGKPRSSSLSPAPVRPDERAAPPPLRGILRGSTPNSHRHAAAPVRGILKKPSLQPQAYSTAPPSRGKEIKQGDDTPIPQRSSKERSRPHSASDPAPHSRAPNPLLRQRSTSLANAEEDYVARACGHLPPFPEQHRHRDRASTLHSTPGSGLVGQASRDSDTDGTQIRRPRGRATSASPHKSSRSSQSKSPSPETRNANDPIQLQGKRGNSVPRLPFQIAYYKDVLHDLAQLLHERRERLADHIDLQVFTEQKQSQRDEREHYLKHKDDPPEKEENSDTKPPRIYYMSIIGMMEVSSTTIVMNGYQHDLPTAMYEIVEELYRTGIYESDLFRGHPSKHNIDKMRRIFDRGYKRSPGIRIGPLAKYRTCDICGLFETILEHLPEPLIPRDLNYGMWAWCVKPVLEREWDILFPPVIKRRRKTLRGTIPEMEHKIIEDPNLTPEERRAVREAFDAPMVELARYALRLLPVEHLSLLVYLFDFFKQVIAYPGNGIDAEFLGEKFGHYLLGGASYAAGRSLMVWMLDRWERLSKGLLDVAPPGTRRFVTHEPDPAHLRAEEARRRKYAVSPHQPYQEGAGDDGEGSSTSSSDTTSTFLNSSDDGQGGGQSGSFLGYYLDEEPRREHPHRNAREAPRHYAGRDFDEESVCTPKPRRRSESRGRDERPRSRHHVDEGDDDDLDLSDADRCIAELERELQQSKSLRRLLRREQPPSRKHHDMLDQDCGDEYSHYF
ncbi:uncharacterized protein C8Q71DRAFT_773262 [Rhodofomes roseus]|uniref:Rho-GAP domain-containing protein n=1 Tax=Rhodofomes roseus TaxID=34475 RepID=A0ABQ8K886_9APHY|nr:uncharacterized protein C8Q71DRAFT_773262 [Rhodofomes roseus]KAH9833413.1 hypothetical protein C8Q71DRAFT_773262 [Rhodofomes roseus]